MKSKRGHKLKKGPFAGYTVRMAATDGIEEYHDRLIELLRDVFDIGGAFISDESTLSDFGCDDADLQILETLYGVMADRHDTLLSVGQRIWPSKLGQTPKLAENE